MSNLHIEGMGLVGCILAQRLVDRGRDFTWSDLEGADPDPATPTLPTAWRASTGACYPSDDSTDQSCYNKISQICPPHPRFQPHLILAAYAHASKNPPHYKNPKAAVIKAQCGNIKVLTEPSIHLNVPDFVLATRDRLRDRLVGSAPPGAVTVVSHGFARAVPTAYMWGWSTRAQLTLGPDLEAACEGRPICLNLQHMRYGTWYAYPVPGTCDHFLGTSIIAQAAPKHLSVIGKFERMLGHLRTAVGEHVDINVPDLCFRQGWRPKATGGDGPQAWRDGAVYRIRPQYASGWRHHPVWLQAVLNLLREDGHL